MKPIRTFSFFFLFALLGIEASWAFEQQFEKIMVNGVSLSTHNSAEQLALQNAFQNAISQAVGTHIKTDSEKDRFKAISNRFYAKAENYIKLDQKLNKRIEGDRLVIDALVEVDQRKLNKDLFLSGLDVESIYGWVEKPRLAIVISEYIDNQVSLTRLGQASLEELFSKKGIKLLDDNRLRTIRENEKAVYFDNEQQAAAFAKRLGAEILIVGKVISNFSREVEVSGYRQKFYHTVFQIKAIAGSTAEIIFSKTYQTSSGSADHSALGNFDAANNSIQDCLSFAKKEIFYQVIKTWYEKSSRLNNFYLIVSGIDDYGLDSLERRLANLSVVKNIFRRAFNNNMAEIEVETKSSNKDFLKTLRSIRGLKIIGSEQSKIVIEIKK